MHKTLLLTWQRLYIMYKDPGIHSLNETMTTLYNGREGGTLEKRVYVNCMVAFCPMSVWKNAGDHSLI